MSFNYGDDPTTDLTAPPAPPAPGFDYGATDTGAPDPTAGLSAPSQTDAAFADAGGTGPGTTDDTTKKTTYDPTAGLSAPAPAFADTGDADPTADLAARSPRPSPSAYGAETYVPTIAYNDYFGNDVSGPAAAPFPDAASRSAHVNDSYLSPDPSDVSNLDQVRGAARQAFEQRRVEINRINDDLSNIRQANGYELRDPRYGAHFNPDAPLDTAQDQIIDWRGQQGPRVPTVRIDSTADGDKFMLDNGGGDPTANLTAATQPQGDSDTGNGTEPPLGINEFGYTPGVNVPSDSLDSTGQAASDYYSNPTQQTADAYRAKLAVQSDDATNLSQAYGTAAQDALTAYAQNDYRTQLADADSLAINPANPTSSLPDTGSFTTPSGQTVTKVDDGSGYSTWSIAGADNPGNVLYNDNGNWRAVSRQEAAQLQQGGAAGNQFAPVSDAPSIAGQAIQSTGTQPTLERSLQAAAMIAGIGFGLPSALDLAATAGTVGGIFVPALGAGYVLKGTGETVGSILGGAPGGIADLTADVPLLGRVTAAIASIPIPETMQNPLALIEQTARQVGQSGDISPLGVAGAIFANALGGDPTTDPMGSVRGFFTQDPVRYAESSGLQRAGIEYLLTSTVALHDPRNGLGVALSVSDPVGRFHDVFTTELAKNPNDPNAAAGAAFDITNNAVAEFLHTYDLLNPMWFALETPGLEKLLGEVFGNVGRGITAIPGIGDVAGKVGDLFLGLSTKSGAEISARGIADTLPAMLGRAEVTPQAAADLLDIGLMARTDIRGARTLARDYATQYGGTVDAITSNASRIVGGEQAQLAARAGDQPYTLEGFINNLSASLRDGTYFESPEGIRGTLTAQNATRFMREGDLATNQAQAVVDRFTRAIRSAEYLRAGLNLQEIENPNLAQKAIQFGADALRTAFLLPGAPALALKKILDEAVRSSTADVFGIRFADTQLARTAGRFLESRQSPALARIGATIEDASTLRGLQARGMPIGRELLRTPESTRAAWSPFRATDKILDSLVSSPTQHVRLAAAYRSLAEWDAAKPQMARDFAANIVSAFDQLPVDRAAIFNEAYGRALSATSPQDFADLANHYASQGALLDRTPNAPSFAGQSRFTPSASVARDINRTPQGLVGDAGTPIAPGLQGRNLGSSAGAGMGQPLDMAADGGMGIHAERAGFQPGFSPRGLTEMPRVNGLDRTGLDFGDVRMRARSDAPVMARPVPNPYSPENLAAITTAPLWAGHTSFAQWEPEARQFLAENFGRDVMLGHNPRQIYDLAVKNYADTQALTRAPGGAGRLFTLEESRNLFRQGLHGANWYEDTAPILRHAFGNETENVLGFLTPTSENASPIENVDRALRLWTQEKQGTLGEFHGGPRTNVAGDLVTRIKAGMEAESPFATGPKPNNFGPDLGGDTRSVTSDRHDGRAWGLPDKPQNFNETLTLEGMQRWLARDLGVEPSQAQAARWTAWREGGPARGEAKRGDPLNEQPIGVVLHGLATRGDLNFMRDSSSSVVREAWQRIADLDPALVKREFSGAFRAQEPFQAVPGAEFGNTWDTKTLGATKDKMGKDGILTPGRVRETALDARIRAAGLYTPEERAFLGGLGRSGSPADNALPVWQPRADVVQSGGARVGQGGTQGADILATGKPPIPRSFDAIDARLRSVGLEPPRRGIVSDRFKANYPSNDMNAAGGFGTGRELNKQGPRSERDEARYARAGAVADEIEQRLANGESIQQIVASRGNDPDALRALREGAHNSEGRAIADLREGTFRGQETPEDLKDHIARMQELRTAAQPVPEAAAPIEQAARPLTAQERLQQVFGDRKIDVSQQPRQIGTDARFTPTQPDPTADLGGPSPFSAPAQLGSGMPENQLRLGAGSDVRPWSPQSVTATPGGTNFHVGPDGVAIPGMPLAPPTATQSLRGAYERAASVAGTRAQTFGGDLTAAAQSGIGRGNAIIGNFQQQTPVGEFLSQGTVNGTQVFLPTIPFAAFHVHTTQFWLEYFLQHPAVPFAIARTLAGVEPDQYGAVNIGGTRVNGLLELSTAAKLTHWAQSMYQYATDAIANPNGNSPWQTAAKILGYGTVGNGAFVGTFPQVQGAGQGLLQSTTNPLTTGKGGVDPREIVKEKGSETLPTGAAQLLNDRFGGNIPRNIVSGVTNPGQQFSNFAESNVMKGVNLLGGSASMKPYNAASGLPYMADNFAQSQGWVDNFTHVTDAKRINAAVSDALTGTPTTPDGKALLAAYNRQQDITALTKVSPVNWTTEAGAPRYGEPPPGRNYGPGGGPPFAANYYENKAELPTTAYHGDQVYREAIKQERNPDFGISDAGRNALKGYGAPDEKMNANVSEQRTAQSNRRFDAEQVSSDIATGRYLNPGDRSLLADYEAAKRAYEGAPSKAGSDIRVKDLLGQPGNYYDTIGKAEAALKAGNKDLAGKLFDVANELKNQSPATRDYFAAIETAGQRDQIKRLELRRDDILLNPDIQGALSPLNRVPEAYRTGTGDESRVVQPGTFVPTARDQSGVGVREARQYFDQWTPNQQQAFDAFNDLRASADYQRRNTLEGQRAALTYGTPEYRAWERANAAELNRLTGIVQGAEQDIINRFGANPKELSNQRGLITGSQHPYTDTTVHGAFFEGLSPAEQQAYGRFNDLKVGDAYQQRNDLAATIPNKATDPQGYRDWFRTHGSEYTRLTNLVNAAEQQIFSDTGVNPKDLANRAALAGGYPAPYTDTTIKGPQADFAPSSGTGGGTYAPRGGGSARTFTPYSAAEKAAYARSLHPGSAGGGGSSTYAANQAAGNTFFGEYRAITDKAERAAVLADPRVKEILGAKGVTAAQYQAATAALKEDVARQRVAAAAGYAPRSAAQPSGGGYNQFAAPGSRNIFATPAEIALMARGLPIGLPTYGAGGYGLPGTQHAQGAAGFPSNVTPITAAPRTTFTPRAATGTHGLPGSARTTKKK